MNGDDLLKTIESDENESIIQFGGRVLRFGNIMDEKAIQGDWLSVNNVSVIGFKPTSNHASTLATCTLPILRQ